MFLRSKPDYYDLFVRYVNYVNTWPFLSLSQLADTRGKDRDYSLLHYLVDQLAAVEPELLNFQREILDIHKCSESSTKALEVEIEGIV